jgi:hypothetical protein
MDANERERLSKIIISDQRHKLNESKGLQDFYCCSTF